MSQLGIGGTTVKQLNFIHLGIHEQMLSVRITKVPKNLVLGLLGQTCQSQT